MEYFIFKVFSKNKKAPDVRGFLRDKADSYFFLSNMGVEFPE
jgi:hypothetical protein